MTRWKWLGHQDPGGHAPAKTLNRLAEEGEEGFAIVIGVEDGTALITARGDVVDGAGKFDAKWSCHNAPRFPRMMRNAEGISKM